MQHGSLFHIQAALLSLLHITANLFDLELQENDLFTFIVYDYQISNALFV